MLSSRVHAARHGLEGRGVVVWTTAIRIAVGVVWGTIAGCKEIKLALVFKTVVLCESDKIVFQFKYPPPICADSPLLGYDLG